MCCFRERYHAPGRAQSQCAGEYFVIGDDSSLVRRWLACVSCVVRSTASDEHTSLGLCEERPQTREERTPPDGLPPQHLSTIATPCLAEALHRVQPDEPLPRFRTERCERDNMGSRRIPFHTCHQQRVRTPCKVHDTQRDLLRQSNTNRPSTKRVR